ncbi:MAG TPA: response regulator [Ktedonosporobacter sp.]|nr:response regulator [Ktedonosporobacter sp.]
MQTPMGRNEQPPLQVLVIDPEKDIITFLQSILQPVGFHIEGCRYGQESLVIAGRTSFDLIILELVLPDMDGLVNLCKPSKLGSY